MTPDPHDEYYDRQTLHRYEALNWIGRWRRLGTGARRLIVVMAALLAIAAPASFQLLRMFR